MIRTALVHIRDSVNRYYKNEFGKDKMLVLSNLQNADGSVPDKIADKMVFFLTGISEEPALKNNLNRSRNGADNVFLKAPKKLHINMNLLFCANFEGTAGYEEGLAYLSALVRFFQINKVIQVPNRQLEISSNGSVSNGNGAENGGTSNGSQSRLTFELCQLDYSEMSHLWSAIGGKLMPSVLYKVGIVTFDDVPLSGAIPAIKEI